MFPAETLGKHYLVSAPTGPQGSVVGHTVRLVGNVDGTNLTYNPAVSGAPATLNAGQVVDIGADHDRLRGHRRSRVRRRDGHAGRLGRRPGHAVDACSAAIRRRASSSPSSSTASATCSSRRATTTSTTSTSSRRRAPSSCSTARPVTVTPTPIGTSTFGTFRVPITAGAGVGLAHAHLGRADGHPGARLRAVHELPVSGRRQPLADRAGPDRMTSQGDMTMMTTLRSCCSAALAGGCAVPYMTPVNPPQRAGAAAQHGARGVRASVDVGRSAPSSAWRRRWPRDTARSSPRGNGARTRCARSRTAARAAAAWTARSPGSRSAHRRRSRDSRVVAVIERRQAEEVAVLVHQRLRLEVPLGQKAAPATMALLVDLDDVDAAAGDERQYD